MSKLSFRQLGIFGFYFRTAAAIRRAMRFSFRSLGLARRSSRAAGVRGGDAGGEGRCAIYGRKRSRPDSSNNDVDSSRGGKWRLLRRRRTNLRRGRRPAHVALRAGESLEGRLALVANLSSGSLDLEAVSDTGSSNTDNYTSVTTPQITITIPGGQAMAAGDAIQIYDTSFGNAVVGTYPVVASDLDGTGFFTGGAFGPTRTVTLSTLSGGNPQVHALRARHFDSVANAVGSSAESTPLLTLSIDTIAPAAPLVTSQITNDTTPTISGSTGTGVALAVGETLTVTVNGQVRTPTPDPTGNWTTVALAALAPNTTYGVTATVTDRAGNSVTDGTTDELTIDTAAPLVSAITGPLNTVYVPGSVLTFTLANDNVVFPIIGSGPTIQFNLGSSPVSFTDTGDVVALANNGLIAGDVVRFRSIVSTTGILTTTDYFVVNPQPNTFQVATTPGGPALALTNDGTGTVTNVRTASYRADLSSATSLVLTYTVGTRDVNANFIDTFRFSANGAQDAAGNPLTLAALFPTLYSLNVVASPSTTTTFTNAPSGNIAVPLPLIAVEFAPGVSVGSGPGLLGLDDFQLTRDGVPIALTGASLNYNIANPTPRYFTIGDLEALTGEPGRYVVTFADIGVSPVSHMTWVKSVPTATELTARITPKLANGTAVTATTQLPVEFIDIEFLDGSTPTANPAEVSNVATGVSGAAITQFLLYRNGVPVSWPATATVNQTSTSSFRINGMSATTLQAGIYQVLVKPESGITTFSSPTNPFSTPGASLLATYGTAWTYATQTTGLVALPAAGTYKLGQQLTFTATFTDSVVAGTGVNLPSIALTVDTVTGPQTRNANYRSGSGTTTLTFAYVVQAGDNDIDGVIPNGVFTGTLTDANGFVVVPQFTIANPSNVFTVDGVLPGVASVAVPTPGVYSTGSNLDFVVAFDDIVTVTGSPTLGITIGGIARQAVYNAAASSGSNVVFRYAVTAADSTSGAAGSVTVGGITLSGGTIRDAAANDATLTFVAPTVSGLIVNRLGATVTASANKTYKLGEVIELTATFTQPVTVAGSPTISGTVDSLTGPRTVPFNYVSGSGTTTLTFRYTVVAGDRDSDGIAVTGAISAGITDLAGNAVGVSFNPPTTSGILVDGVLPGVLTVNGPIPGTYIRGVTGQDTLTFIVPFDDAVTVSGSGIPTLRFTLGSNVRQAVFAGNTGFTGTALEFRYTVQSGDYATSASVAANPISLNGATIRDANGNDANLTTAAATFPGVVVNVTSVTRVVLASADNIYYRAGNTILLDATFDAPVTVTGTPTIPLQLNQITRNATYVSGSGSTTLRFAYTVVAGDLDLDGLQFGFPSIVVPGGASITNTGGQVLLAFVPPDISGMRVDAVVPTVTGVTVPTAGNYNLGDALQFTVTFSESVRVTPETGTGNVPRIALVIGSSTRYANYVAGSETPVLVFDYIVADNDLDLNGIVVGTAILLNGAFINDLAGNTSGLVIAPGPTTGVLVDGIAPLVTRFSVPGTFLNGSYRAGTSIPIRATTSEPVVAGSTLTIGMDTGAVVTLTAATAGTTLSGTYLVAAGQNSPDLTVTEILDSTVADAFGNGLGSTALPTGVNNIGGARNIVIDTTAPAIALALGVGVADGATGAEATQASGVVVVTGDNGLPISVTFTRGTNTVTKGPLTGTGAAQAVVLTSADVTTLGNGTVTVTASQTDAAGNAGTATSSFTLDTAPPSAPILVLGTGIVNGATQAEATQATGVVTVTGEVGAVITVLFARNGNSVTKTLTGTGASQAVLLTAAEAASLGDGTVTVTASQTDAAGNPQSGPPASISFSIDTSAPAAAPLTLGPGVTSPVGRSRATQASGIVTVNGESGATITVTFTGNGGASVVRSVAATGAQQAVVLTDAQVTTLGDGSVTVTAAQTDAAGNAQTTASGSVSFVLDLTAPNAVLVALGSGVSDGATGAEATQASGVVLITGEAGLTITVLFTRNGNSVTKVLTATGAAQAVVLTSADVTTLGNGTVTVTSTQVDAAGNQSSPAITTFVLDLTPPGAPILALGTGVANGATQAEATQASGVVTVNGESGATITVLFTRNGNTVTKSLAGTGAPQAVVLTSVDVTTLGDGVVTVTSTQTDTAGNPQVVPQAVTSFTLDTSLPTVVALSSTVPNGTYRTGSRVEFAVDFSEAVFVTGTPRFLLNTTPARYATYTSGSGSTRLLFSYQVELGDSASRLNRSGSLNGPGMTIRDQAGNLANPALRNLSLTTNLVVDGSLAIVPTSGFGASSPGPSFSQPVTSIPITFNAPVTGVTLQSFRLFFENRSVSLAGAVLRGSGTSWTLTLPRQATSLRGNYRLEVGGPGSGITSNGIPMNNVSAIFWRRV